MSVTEPGGPTAVQPDAPAAAWWRALAQALADRLSAAVGGPARTRVVVLLACVLALDSADKATVGAVAGELERALHITNTGLGLLAALPSLVGAIATIPLGMLTDRRRRVPLLTASIVMWSAAMILSGASASFGMLLVMRTALGAVTATAGPTLASLSGDFFPGRDRARIYGFILTGELVGAGFGFLVSGEVAAALSWRAAFYVLAVPSLALALVLWRWLPEPARGGSSRLQPGANSIVPAGEATRGVVDDADEAPAREQGALAQEAVRSRNVAADPDLVLHEDPVHMRLWTAVRYVLRVRTNVVLIVASAFGYFYFAGVQTFGVVFFRGQYSVTHAAATLLLVLLGLGALVGVLGGGRLADRLIRRGRINGRILVAAGAYLVAAIAFVPAILSRSLAAALPLYMIAGAALSAPNPPLDAARLDIMHSRLWGRAESIRTVLRQGLVASAPLVFGFIADQFVPGHRASAAQHGFGASANAQGLRDAFLIMLVALATGGLIMLRALRTYPRDVATAVASEAATSARDADAPG